MDERAFAVFVLGTLRGELSEALRRQGIVILADYIYNECYSAKNDVLGTSHYVGKASAIAGWLQEDDLQDATLEGLVEEWKEYDSQEEESDE